MRRDRALVRWSIGAALAGALVAIAAPVQADPPWRRGGWHHHSHRWGPPPRHYPAPRVYYPPPPVYYAPPPVYYAPPPPVYVAPGLSFGLNIPLR